MAITDKLNVLINNSAFPLKDFIRKSRIYRRLAGHFRKGCLSLEELQVAFLQGNAWLFTQPKSGTNLICSVLAFYNAERLGITDYSFADRYKLGLVHGARIKAQDITELNDFRLKSNVPIFVRTHRDVPNAAPKFLIATTRDVLDITVSTYHYLYEPSGITLDRAIEPIIARFIEVHKAQIQAMERIEHCMLVDYQDLISNQEDVFTRILQMVFGFVEASCLRTAMERASVNQFKRWEEKDGAAIRDELKQYRTSFIRSGKVGEGKEVLNAPQKQRIAALLETGGFPELWQRALNAVGGHCSKSGSHHLA